jgi:diaminohydroxyphosphoribosylaminopyrimidine deaminase/5-amino-6-(5-phosphoribosylamino)uracil reductase
MSREQRKASSGPGAAEDEARMRQALDLARRGEGRTRPNPPVGAVIVREGTLLGKGFHHRAGGPHAEIEALRGLERGQTEGATLYVTLEPCSTHGRTPPCTDAILRSGIARVVASVKDPNPKHAGRGLRLLARNGIDVVSGVCRQEGGALIAPFAKWIATGRPYVTLKMGMTLDGRIADADGCSRWITGASARREVKELRRRADAVLVGANTAVCDNPSLRWSAARGGVNPLRLVLDAAGRLPLDSKVFTDGQSGNTVIVATSRCPAVRRAAIEATGARVWICGRGSRVDLEELLALAGSEGLLHVLCEGGGVLAEDLVRQRLVDAYWFYVAPRFLGGGGVPVLGGAGWPLAAAPALEFTDVRRIGGDVLIRAVPAGEG